MTPTFNKEFSFFLIAWVINSDNNFTKSVVIQKWYKQLWVLKHGLRITPREEKKTVFPYSYMLKIIQLYSFDICSLLVS